MAQKVQVILVDDLDGGEADETVSFSLDGVAYEVDLSSENAEKLREVFSEYVGAARRVGGRASASRSRRSGGGGGSSSSRGETSSAAIREWARQNDMQVNERGRIPAHVVEAYKRANG
jgi:nucleoid-associated protein Lsr2